MWSSDILFFVVLGSIIMLPFFAVLQLIDHLIDSHLQDDSDNEFDDN